MSGGLSRFAVKFHTRLQTVPREQHLIISELIIGSLDQCQLALDLIGVHLLIEDNKGKPRRLKAWTKAMRELMDQIGCAVRMGDALEVLEGVEDPKDFAVVLNFGNYPDINFSVKEIIKKNVAVGLEVLNFLGCKAMIEKNGTLYEVPQFVEQFLNPVAP